MVLIIVAMRSSKKRIDKATIRGTEERLTQIDHIAIVYAHEEERKDYIELVNYFISQGYLNNDLEDFELNDLQGVMGLRSFRISINMETAIKLVEEDLSNPLDSSFNEAA
jgi:hypothetical protein